MSGLGSGDVLDLVLSLECPCLVVVRDTLYARLFVEMSVLVRFHLRETKNSVLTLPERGNVAKTIKIEGH